MAVAITPFLRDDVGGDGRDADLEPMEQELITPNFFHGLKVVPNGEVLNFMAWTDVPGGKYAGETERRVSDRFIMTRTTARKLYKDLVAILNAGN